MIIFMIIIFILSFIYFIYWLTAHYSILFFYFNGSLFLPVRGGCHPHSPDPDNLIRGLFPTHIAPLLCIKMQLEG